MSILSKSTPSTEVELAQSPAAGKQKRAGLGPELAASPRANLLPPEIGESIRRMAVRRGLRVIVVVAVVIGALGIVGAWRLSEASQSALADAQAKTQQLATQKAGYGDVAKTIDGIAAGKAAVKVGGSTDIDWAAYLAKLQANLPQGVSLTSVSVASADAITPFAQSTVPLEGSRIATITFSADSAVLPSIPDWIDGLSGLPGFADASPDSVTSTEKGYTASVTMHIDTEAFSHRFAPAEKEASK